MQMLPFGHTALERADDIVKEKRQLQASGIGYMVSKQVNVTWDTNRLQLCTTK